MKFLLIKLRHLLFQKYSVMPTFSDPPLMWMERAATSRFRHTMLAFCMLPLFELYEQTCCYTAGLFGVKRYGVHINGYTVSSSGEVSMWLARRSHTKQTYPGLLDNMVRADCDNNIQDNNSRNESIITTSQS